MSDTLFCTVYLALKDMSKRVEWTGAMENEPEAEIVERLQKEIEHILI